MSLRFKFRAEKIMSLLPPPGSDIDSSSDQEDELKNVIFKNDENSDYSESLSLTSSLVSLLENDLDCFDNNEEDLDDISLKNPKKRKHPPCSDETNTPKRPELQSPEHFKYRTANLELEEREPAIPEIILEELIPPSSLDEYNSKTSNLNDAVAPLQSNISPIRCKRKTKSKNAKKRATKTSNKNKKSKHIPKKKSNKSTSTKIKFNWKKEPFIGQATIPENDFSLPLQILSPYEYFKLFFDEELINLIVENSNLYSVQKDCNNPLNTSANEMKSLLAIFLKMGIVQMPAYTDYWSDELRYEKVASIMPLKRFQKLRQNLHFVNNEIKSEDPYFKLRPFLERIRNNCLKIEEEERFSVDEMMIPYKGKKAGYRRQYLKNKPNKWGFKMFVRSGVSGLIYDFFLYAGKNTFPYTGHSFSSKESQFGLGGKIVIAFAKSIKNQCCKALYFDNYFSSPSLVAYLRNKMGIFSVATLRKNRSKCEIPILKKRGDFIMKCDNNKKVCIVQWMDNKPVLVCSSYVADNPISKIKRYDKQEKQKIDVPCPQIILDYNAHMGGVDLADMLVALYKTQYKCRKWYLPIFIQMLDICVNNAWLLYRRELMICKRSKEAMPLKKFRLRVAEALEKKDKCPGRPSLSKIKELPKKINNPVAPRPCKDVRCDSFGHLPDFTSQGRCKYCVSGKTTVICRKCNVRLCFVPKRNCFSLFHSDKLL